MYFFFFNETATPEIYTLSLHAALPIFLLARRAGRAGPPPIRRTGAGLGPHPRRLASARSRRPAAPRRDPRRHGHRSEEHTSELQSRQYLVCRLLLEKKKSHIPERLS